MNKRFVEFFELLLDNPVLELSDKHLCMIAMRVSKMMGRLVILESKKEPKTCFATLQYDEETMSKDYVKIDGTQMFVQMYQQKKPILQQQKEVDVEKVNSTGKVESVAKGKKKTTSKKVAK